MSIEFLRRLVERDDLEGFCAAADKLHPSDAHKAIDAMDSIQDAVRWLEYAERIVAMYSTVTVKTILKDHLQAIMERPFSMNATTWMRCLSFRNECIERIQPAYHVHFLRGTMMVLQASRDEWQQMFDFIETTHFVLDTWSAVDEWCKQGMAVPLSLILARLEAKYSDEKSRKHVVSHFKVHLLNLLQLVLVMSESKNDALYVMLDYGERFSLWDNGFRIDCFKTLACRAVCHPFVDWLLERGI
jgi:hypothetical protein